MRFPEGMRPATLAERQEYYAREFDWRGVDRWVGDRRRTLKFAMILGRHTGIVSERHANERDDVVIIDDWTSAKDIREYALEYLPEGLYYDRNRYIDVRDCVRCARGRERCRACHNFNGQQLAFDLDPENVDCPYHGHIGQKMDRGSGLSFCMYEFKVVRKQAILLFQEMVESFDRVSVVYSGRGFHIVVGDEEGYSLRPAQRRTLARRVAKRYPIDEWVTEGGSRLLRLPSSLNGVVSRKCVEMRDVRGLRDFDPRTSELAVPRFMKSS